MRYSLVEKLNLKAYEFIGNSRIPVLIGDVARRLNISWSTARQILMELLVEGKVECEKTTNS